MEAVFGVLVLEFRLFGATLGSPTYLKPALRISQNAKFSSLGFLFEFRVTGQCFVLDVQ